jgi:hypothetical protein
MKISCWAIYRDATKRIVVTFRTMKEVREFYPSGIPIGCELVKLEGVLPPSSTKGYSP